ncbi:MAG: glycosyltransferase family 39 protein, partial [Chloroflexota bacterium]
MLKRRFSLILMLVLLATVYRLYQIQTQSIWFDEGWSAYAAAQPTLDAAWRADPTNPPLYYVLLNIAAHLFGTTEFALRFVSLLLGLPLIPLVFQLARRSARSERAGRYAVLLTAISAPLWWASQEARMYTLLALLIVICALAWQMLITRPRRAAWIALWLGELALLYAHNTGPIAAIWLNAVTLLIWIVRRRPDLRIWIGGQIVVGLLWLPYFLQRFVLLQAANSAVTSAPQIGVPLLAEIWAGLWVAPWALAIKGLP